LLDDTLQGLEEISPGADSALQLGFLALPYPAKRPDIALRWEIATAMTYPCINGFQYFV
jgi:hypothetical protein